MQGLSPFIIDTIKKIKSVLESFGFPVKADWGTDYGKL